MTRSINIETNPSDSIISFPDLLLTSGWHHPGGRIHVFIQDDIDKPSDQQIYPIEEWGLVKEIMRKKFEHGLPIGLGLSWHTPSAFIEIRMYPDGKVAFFLSDSSPTIRNSGGFTDFTWFLERILPPITPMTTILKITCDDDAY